MDDIDEEYEEALRGELPLNESTPVVLECYAKMRLATLLSPPILSLHRLVVGESSRFPDLARLYYKRGPMTGVKNLRRYFFELMKVGTMRSGDADLAVRQFVGLCQSGRYQLAVLGLHSADDPNRSCAEIAAAVSAFCRIWLADEI